MAEFDGCLGHEQRAGRRNKIKKLFDSPLKPPEDEIVKVLIKKGPVSIETTLKELKENYASKPEWKVIEGGGVLSVPVEEFRMIVRAKFGLKKRIEKVLLETKLNNIPLLTTASEDAAQAMANKLPKFTAVQMWLDDKAEIDLNKALERMITKLEISALIQVH